MIGSRLASDWLGKESSSYRYRIINVNFFYILQGRFSINLKGTGIRLTSKVMWGSTGKAYSQIIYRYRVSIFNKQPQHICLPFQL